MLPACIMGNVGSGIFGACPLIRGTKRLNISVSSSSFYVCISCEPIPIIIIIMFYYLKGRDSRSTVHITQKWYTSRESWEPEA